ncbi:hypothetical protein ABVB69_08695 [Streptomyces sp. NPDC000349]|uniref:hypothetical protein n=1 Tax=unclassified Streptomyces TaxID=2593676 RepID=UPI0027835DAE|nr:hypothetical protein [Streptomyces sp. DSM 40167]MDQ0405606.1 hypothetical protein [Streptomyces sp. DSM 40167]
MSQPAFSWTQFLNLSVQPSLRPSFSMTSWIASAARLAAASRTSLAARSASLAADSADEAFVRVRRALGDPVQLLQLVRQLSAVDLPVAAELLEGIEDLLRPDLADAVPLRRIGPFGERSPDSAQSPGALPDPVDVGFLVTHALLLHATSAPATAVPGHPTSFSATACPWTTTSPP